MKKITALNWNRNWTLAATLTVVTAFTANPQGLSAQDRPQESPYSAATWRQVERKLERVLDWILQGQDALATRSLGRAARLQNRASSMLDDAGPLILEMAQVARDPELRRRFRDLRRQANRLGRRVEAARQRAETRSTAATGDTPDRDAPDAGAGAAVSGGASPGEGASGDASTGEGTPAGGAPDRAPLEDLERQLAEVAQQLTTATILTESGQAEEGRATAQEAASVLDNIEGPVHEAASTFDQPELRGSLQQLRSWSRALLGAGGA